MSWSYEQSTGNLYRDDDLVACGYSGCGDGKNNPSMEGVKGIGPLPKGKYTINAPIDTRTHGPFVMWLTPDPSNDMLGRSAFGIHGDSKVSPGNASEGCIVLPRAIRESIWQSGDTSLTVV